jgi:hypothetical protein
MLEYVVAATLTWASPTGKLLDQPLNGTFDTMEECREFVMKEQRMVFDIQKAPAIVTGTLCEQRTVRPKAKLSPATERAAKAAAAAAGKAASAPAKQ